MLVVLKLIYNSNLNLGRIILKIKIDKGILKLKSTSQCKGSRMAKTALKDKNKVEIVTLPDTKTYCQAIVLKLRYGTK